MERASAGRPPSPPLPRRHALGLGERPQAPPRGAGLGFEGEEHRVVAEAAVDPGVPGADELAGDADVVGVDLADRAAVAVGIDGVDADLLAKDAGREGLLRALGPGLAALGGVDAGEPDAAAFAADQHLDRVAVENGDDAGVEEGLGRGGRRGGGERGGEEERSDDRRAHAPGAYRREARGHGPWPPAITRRRKERVAHLPPFPSS